MQLKIDTKRKTIILEEKVSLGELMCEIQKLRPHDWHEYTIEPMIINQSQPQVYVEHRPCREFPYKWENPYPKSYLVPGIRWINTNVD